MTTTAATSTKPPLPECSATPHYSTFTNNIQQQRLAALQPIKDFEEESYSSRASRAVSNFYRSLLYRVGTACMPCFEIAAAFNLFGLFTPKNAVEDDEDSEAGRRKGSGGASEGRNLLNNSTATTTSTFHPADETQDGARAKKAKKKTTKPRSSSPTGSITSEMSSTPAAAAATPPSAAAAAPSPAPPSAISSALTLGFATMAPGAILAPSASLDHASNGRSPSDSPSAGAKSARPRRPPKKIDLACQGRVASESILMHRQQQRVLRGNGSPAHNEAEHLKEQRSHSLTNSEGRGGGGRRKSNLAS